MMEMLLENGANIDAQTGNGATALHLATFHGKEVGFSTAR
jgi:ankyrin repeat protein